MDRNGKNTSGYFAQCSARHRNLRKSSETYINEFSAITFVKESNGIIRLRGPLFFLLINQRPVLSEQRNVKRLMHQLH